MPTKKCINKVLWVFFRDSGKFEAEFPLLGFNWKAEGRHTHMDTLWGRGQAAPQPCWHGSPLPGLLHSC